MLLSVRFYSSWHLSTFYIISNMFGNGYLYDVSRNMSSNLIEFKSCPKGAVSEEQVLQICLNAYRRSIEPGLKRSFKTFFRLR